MNHALDDIPAAATRIAQLRHDAGRVGGVEITLGGGGDLDDLRRRADLGVGRALVRPWQSSKDALESMRRFADEVLPEIRDYPVTVATP
jgi:hypothetical protein